jgi:hypothetical protein
MVLSSTNFCNTCGAANRHQARFCRVCGNLLNSTGNGALNKTLTGLLPNALLKQRYVIIAQAGRGGFGALTPKILQKLPNPLTGKRCS